MASGMEPGLLSGTVGQFGRMDLRDRLREALLPPGSEPFTLAFQPIVELASGKVSSLEALVRWPLQPGLLVPPSEFVVLAERMGLVPHLDRWVLDAACAEAARWDQPWGVSVNISAASFGLIDVAAMAEEALRASGLPAGRLIVEMTETALAGDAGRARRAVEAIRDLGVGVALDDFGGGHGSLTTLRQFPFTKLKIDRSLVDKVDEDPVQERVLRLVAGLGQALGTRVVAEGVETAGQLRKVQECGAACAQGYLLARPAPPDRVAEVAAASEAGVRRVLHGEGAEPARAA